MKKSEFIDRVAEKAELSKAAATRAVEAIFDTTSGAISEALRSGGQVGLPGFGRFKSKTRSARKGRNPQTGAEIDIPERTVVQFSAGRGLNDSLGGGGGAARKSGGAAKKSAGGAAKKASGGAAKSSGGAAKKSGGAAKGSGRK